ncbi:MAG: hypothetical protein HQM12_20940, partial [SAR324 cluster bacterium]|nr:hypothetical protein [SAR324 cluster bacterium]
MTEQNVSLEQQIEALTEENRKLRQVIESKDQELNSTLRLVTAGESVAMIVHEVLNPITSIMSRLQYLVDEESD